jgi:hypothetical protein
MDAIKKAIICKEVGDYSVDSSINKSHIPRMGDVAVFRVMELGKHKAVQGTGGNNAYIYEGDLVMAAFGNRYASNQLEGYVPDSYHDEYHILGKGGCVGVLKTLHAKFEMVGPTKLELIGYATDSNGDVINTIYLNKQQTKFNPQRKNPFKVVLSIGSSMDSGKTTSAAFLCRGLHLAGKRVGYIKMTGTVYTRDRHFVRDCGADISVDFSNLGYPATFMAEFDELLDIYESLLDMVAESNPDYVIMEIADGLLQRETRWLLSNPEFMGTIHSIMMSCGDSLGAKGGIDFLRELGREPFCVTGLFTISPLLTEEIENNITVPVITGPVLMSAAIEPVVAQSNMEIKSHEALRNPVVEAAQFAMKQGAPSDPNITPAGSEREASSKKEEVFERTEVVDDALLLFSDKKLGKT